jgi:hypothetical protein
MDDEAIQYFSPNSYNIINLRKIIKSQGFFCCHEKIEQQWINTSISKLSFGYTYLTLKAQIGRRSIKKPEDKYLLQGFVLCRIDKDLPSIAWIDLICSKHNSKTGKLLLDLAEEHIRTNIPSVKLIQLYSLPQPKLKSWYLKNGYGVSDVRIWDGKLKSYLMNKFLLAQ